MESVGSKGSLSKEQTGARLGCLFITLGLQYVNTNSSMYSRDYPGSYRKYYFPFSLKKLCQRKVISIKFKINVERNKNIFFKAEQLCDVCCQYSFDFFPRVEVSCQGGGICFITFSRAADQPEIY